MKAWQIGILGVIICTVASAEECIKGTFYITYSCGANSEIVNDAELPDTVAATYGASVTVPLIASNICTPPTGKMWAGNWIGESGGYTTSTAASTSFTYYFTHNIEITPRWIDVDEYLTQKFLMDNYKTGGTSYCRKSHNGVIQSSDGGTLYTSQQQCTDSVWNSMERGDWGVVFPYGTVVGTSVCSTLPPENTTPGYYTGYIADDQTTVQNEYDAWVSNNRPTSVAGRYCYCRLKDPVFAGSPWVFGYGGGSTSFCAYGCAYLCGYYVRSYAVMRGAVFAARGGQ